MSKSKAIAAPPMPAMAEEKPDHLDEYKVRNAADDMMRAGEHMQNPKMMAAVQKHLKKKSKAISSIAMLKKKKQQVDAQANAAKGAPADDEAMEGESC